jgi:hypothetical protein
MLSAFEKLKVHAKNPWTWFILLVIVGIGLSAGAAPRTVPLRIAETPGASITPENSCIPLMERDTNGTLTGRVSCASLEQVRAFCEGVLKEGKK